MVFGPPQADWSALFVEAHRRLIGAGPLAPLSLDGALVAWTCDWPLPPLATDPARVVAEIFAFGGDSLHPALRRELFRGADGVLFLATPEHPRSERLAFEALRGFLRESGQGETTVLVWGAAASLELLPTLEGTLAEGLEQALGSCRAALQGSAGVPVAAPRPAAARASAILEVVLQQSATPILQEFLREEARCAIHASWPREGRTVLRLLHAYLEEETVHLDLLCSVARDPEAQRMRLCLTPAELPTPPAPPERSTPTYPAQRADRVRDGLPLGFIVVGTLLSILAGFLLGFLAYG